jgi:hypothetical protein
MKMKMKMKMKKKKKKEEGRRKRRGEDTGISCLERTQIFIKANCFRDWPQP